MQSLWGEEFKLEDTPKKIKKVKAKIDKPLTEKDIVKKIHSKVTDIRDRLELIKSSVLNTLGSYRDNTQVIRTKEQLMNLITAANINKIIAIDTETNNSLDPLTCKLMGPCLYTPNEKQAYIPLHHINPTTLEELPDQLSEEDVCNALKLLDPDVRIIMHNGKFDYKVLKCTIGYETNIYWDTLIGARLLDENEMSAGLKQQYIDKIDPSIEKYSINHLFEGVEYAMVDPDIFALYAATDSYMTYKLYEWQRDQFNRPDHSKLLQLLLDIEMPIVKVSATMELTGVALDKEYGALLSAKYHKKLENIDIEIATELELLKPAIAEWRLSPDANFQQQKKPKADGTITYEKSKSEKLKDPINVASSTQLAILLYDVLKTPALDKKTPRGTGEEILEKMHYPICKLILKRRGLLKLIDTYIDKLQEITSIVDDRVHGEFNQLGTVTGRFASRGPNLQNIPAANKEIRMLFKATDGYKMIGSDFSQQEVRLLAEYANDENMIESYRQDKDIYATVAAMIHGNKYEDNLEFYPDGTPNPAGKKRRGACKSIVLGLMYQRGAKSIAEQTGQTIDEAQKIIDTFYHNFPRVRDYVNDTQGFAKVNGFVEDFWGRRRRLPDVKLDKYVIKDLSTTTSSDFNPLLDCKGLIKKSINPKIAKYKQALSKIRNRLDYQNLQNQALRDNIKISDNTGFIAAAERQSVNSRIQGGAATLTKVAMIRIYEDKELADLGFRLLLAVHDELIGECPEANADKAAERLSYLMCTAGEPLIKIPFKCDADIMHCWGFNDFKSVVRKEFKDMLAKKISSEQAFSEVCQERTESTIDQLHELLDDLM